MTRGSKQYSTYILIRAQAKRIKLGGAGTTILTVIIGIVSSVWPEIFKPHPRLLWFLGIAGICMIILGAHFDDQVEESRAVNAEDRKVNAVGRDNSGKQINAEIVHYHEAPGNPASLALEEQAVIQSTRGPIITIGPPGRKHLHLGRLNVFAEVPGETGTPCFAVLWIMNERGGRRASSLSVSLTFEQSGKVTAHINRAFWIGEAGNQKSLDVGTREAVVLGFHSEGFWCVHANARKHPVPPARTASRRVQQIQNTAAVHPQYLSFESSLEVEVAVMNSSTDETLAVSRYTISPSAEHGFTLVSL